MLCNFVRFRNRHANEKEPSPLKHLHQAKLRLPIFFIEEPAFIKAVIGELKKLCARVLLVQRSPFSDHSFIENPFRTIVASKNHFRTTYRTEHPFILRGNIFKFLIHKNTKSRYYHQKTVNAVN